MKTHFIRSNLGHLRILTIPAAFALAIQLSHAASGFDLARDFTTNSNPNGAWSYGWKQSLGSVTLNLYTHNHTGFAENETPVQVIDAEDFALPEIYFNGGSNTVVTDGGVGQFPPRTVWYDAGNNGTIQNYGVIRFTAPSNAAYQVGISVASHLPANLSGDTEFYVVRNSSELTGWFLPAGGNKAVTNLYTLAAGDTLDFAIGRGADGDVNASALKISALITPITNVVVTNPPPICTFALSPSNATYGASGGTGVVAVTTQTGCGWSAFSTNTWLHVGPATNVGSGALMYLVDTNPSSATRIGTIRIGGQNFLVNQAGATVLTNAPPEFYTDFNLARDFRTNSNPNGVWHYGYTPTLGGPFTLMNTPRGDESPAIPVFSWSVDGYSSPDVHYNASSSNILYADGGTFPPGTLWVAPGHQTSPNTFAVMRFSAPSNGTYFVRTLARSYLDELSGDTDFHVLVTNVEVFNHFLPAGKQSAGYTNLHMLKAGENVDFVVGRGADNNLDRSALKLEAVLVPTTNSVVTNPPPVVYSDFNLSRDFLLSTNPAGPWRYGWKQSLDGSFDLLPAFRTFSSDNGVPISVWELSTYNLPAVAKVTGNSTAISDVGRFTAPAGTVYFAPGADGTPQNFGVIRFVAPSNGNYAVQAVINPLFDSTRSRDSDFHVVKNGAEVYGVALPPNFGTNVFSGVMALTAGEPVDFAIGRGPDGTTVDTGLKIAAIITPTTNVITITNPPPVYADFNLTRDFSTNTNPNGVWSYGWQTNLGVPLTLLNGMRNAAAPNGTPYQILEFLPSSPPLIMDYPISNTTTGTSGSTLYPPGTLLLDPGTAAPYNLVTVRFTAPSNGSYQVRATVAPEREGSPQGDTDFHIAKNGSEVFGQFLAPLDRVAYSNVLVLSAGDKVDFAVGRGADNSEYGSIVRLTAIITPTTNGVVVTNPPVVFPDFNLTRDFSTNSNPNGAWSYGWKQSFTNVFNPYTLVRTAAGDNGVPVQVLEATPFALPELLFNATTNTTSSDSGQAQYPPKTLWYYPGEEGSVQTYGAIRFTAPSNGNFRVGVAVRSYLSGPNSGDTDFHVLKNDSELFGQFVPPEGSASYSNTLVIAAGETIDFLVGRGNDNSAYGSGLKISAVITPTSQGPTLNAPGETKTARVYNFTRLDNGDIQFTVTGDAATTYMIEASSDLKNWMQVGTVVDSGGVIQFTDPDASFSPTRFYRATPITP